MKILQIKYLKELESRLQVTERLLGAVMGSYTSRTSYVEEKVRPAYRPSQGFVQDCKN